MEEIKGGNLDAFFGDDSDSDDLVPDDEFDESALNEMDVSDEEQEFPRNPPKYVLSAIETCKLTTDLDPN